MEEQETPEGPRRGLEAEASYQKEGDALRVVLLSVLEEANSFVIRLADARTWRNPVELLSMEMMHYPL